MATLSCDARRSHGIDSKKFFLCLLAENLTPPLWICRRANSQTYIEDLPGLTARPNQLYVTIDEAPLEVDIATDYAG